MSSTEITNSPVCKVSLLQEVLNPVPFWSKDRCPLLWACLYWNGFPTHWNRDDLINLDNHHAKTVKEAKKQRGRFQRLLTMHQSALDHVKNGTLKCIKMEEPYVTPFEFARFCAAQRWMPVVKVFRELKNASSNIAAAIIEIFEERAPPPALASQVIKNTTKSLKMLHRDQVISEANKIFINHRATHGEELTPTEIYKHPNFQICLKRLRDAEDCIVSYPRKEVIKRWIPSGVPKRLEVGRPKKIKKSPI